MICTTHIIIMHTPPGLEHRGIFYSLFSNNAVTCVYTHTHVSILSFFIHIYTSLSSCFAQYIKGTSWKQQIMYQRGKRTPTMFPYSGKKKRKRKKLLHFIGSFFFYFLFFFKILLHSRFIQVHTSIPPSIISLVFSSLPSWDTTSSSLSSTYPKRF